MAADFQVDVPAIPIWRIFASLFKAGPEQFRVSVLGDGGNNLAKEFWTRARTQPWGANHPALAGRSDEELSKIIPVQLHVDGADLFRNTEYVVFSVSSVLADTTDISDLKFQFLKVPAECCKTKELLLEVMQRVAAFVAWNVDILQSGVRPSVGFYGEDLEGGGEPFMHPYTAAYALFKSDGKARAECHAYEMNYSTIFCCDRCFATQPYPSVLRSKRLSELLYTDFRATAGWRSKQIDHPTYMRDCGRRSPWAAVSGFRQETVLHDWMHTGPLGFLRDLCGSVIIDLLTSGHLAKHFAVLAAGSSNNDVLVRCLWIDFRAWCKTCGLSKPKGYLSMRSLGRGSSSQVYPEIGSGVKAVTVKNLTMYLATVTAQHVTDEDRRHTRLRHVCQWSMAEFVRIMDENGLMLTTEQAELLDRRASVFLSTYQALATAAASQKQFLYKMRPKLHYFVHMVAFTKQSLLNPTRLGCWSDETYLHFVKKIAGKCHGLTMMRTSLLRYFIHLGLKWDRRRRESK